MTQKLRLEIEKWWITIKISWAQLMVYKFNFIIVILGPSIIFFFIKYNLWTSIYQLEGVDVIEGYTWKNMIFYQFWVLIIDLITKGYRYHDLAVEIRMGQISKYLTRPFSFWKFQIANFFSLQIIQIFIALITIFAVFGILFKADLTINIFSGILFSLYVSLLWFLIQSFLGLMAFWLEETWVFC